MQYRRQECRFDAARVNTWGSRSNRPMRPRLPNHGGEAMLSCDEARQPVGGQASICPADGAPQGARSPDRCQHPCLSSSTEFWILSLMSREWFLTAPRQGGRMAGVGRHAVRSSNPCRPAPEHGLKTTRDSRSPIRFLMIRRHTRRKRAGEARDVSLIPPETAGSTANPGTARAGAVASPSNCSEPVDGQEPFRNGRGTFSLQPRRPVLILAHVANVVVVWCRPGG
jgi:hypothetical protein